MKLSNIVPNTATLLKSNITTGCMKTLQEEIKLHFSFKRGSGIEVLSIKIYFHYDLVHLKLKVIYFLLSFFFPQLKFCFRVYRIYKRWICHFFCWLILQSTHCASLLFSVFLLAFLILYYFVNVFYIWIHQSCFQPFLLFVLTYLFGLERFGEKKRSWYDLSSLQYVDIFWLC